MINIRFKLFETNSSSNDTYDDSDSLPDRATASQTIRIVVDYADDITDARYDEICNTIENLGDKICEICSISEDMELEFDYTDVDIYLKAIINAYWRCVSEGYAGDRYEPPSDPEFEFYWDEFPASREDSPKKAQMKEQLLKLFAANNIPEILDIIEIYGEDVDEEEFNDSLWN